ncbi:MAG: isocitrate lyase/phosphoenolpyruvate mutase family protein [Solirubrobacteraceae bacterium]
MLRADPWGAGSICLLASLGFAALAMTSSGFAATLGRVDGSVTREEGLAHAAEMVAATGLPVSAELENRFVDAPEGLAETAGTAAGMRT